MTFWVVRAGKYGQHEEIAHKNNIVTIGWDLPDLSKIQTREQLEEMYAERYGPNKKRHVANVVGQIWTFLKKIEKGDLVALPLKRKSEVMIGEVTGDYKFKKIEPDIRHVRSVKWLDTFPRSSFDQDILFSFGAYLTVGTVRREDAEDRVRQMLKGKPVQSDLDFELGSDLEQYSKDQITKLIERKFVGHDLVRLIDEILRAKGYSTKISTPGPDGGVDILGGAGPIGFESHNICVQVKSSKTPIDVRVVREFDSVVAKFQAEHGLLVAWGGINRAAEKESSEMFFSMRVWDQNRVVEEVMRNYERFSDSMKVELPLKKIWILVEEGED